MGGAAAILSIGVIRSYESRGGTRFADLAGRAGADGSWVYKVRGLILRSTWSRNGGETDGREEGKVEVSDGTVIRRSRNGRD